MSVARRDDRHKAELVDEIATMFDKTRETPTEKSEDDDGTEPTPKPAPRIRITGDKRQDERQPGG
ncbi:MAG: hypothetical protein GEU98_18300 [Pseudonocardiaceae bacterium]|nr:hypothetical protein [Pseudonocardiaceae bacterium]